MPGKTFAAKMAEWRYLVEHGRPLLAEAPHLVGDHATLEAVYQQAQGLDAEAQRLRSRRKEVFQLRREAEIKGDEIRARLAGALVHHFGPKSEKLISFGVSPRPRAVRRTSTAKKELAALKAQLEKVQSEGTGPEAEPEKPGSPPADPTS
jgi:hypothetical protein